MTAISTRDPDVIVEYERNGTRRRKYFTNIVKARSFYARKLHTGHNPKVVKTIKLKSGE